MLSEDLINKRADTSSRLMTHMIKMIEATENVTEDRVNLCGVLANFISANYLSEVQADMTEQLKTMMRKANHDLGKLD